MSTLDRARGKDANEIGPEAEAPESAAAQQLRTLAMRRRMIQRKAARASAAKTQIPESGGAPLAGDVQARIAPHLGADLSAVKVHTGSDSARAATDLNARAFTVGSDVHFAAGQFAPGTREGDRLLAHELTHVVQGQQSGVQRQAEPGAPEAPEVSQPHEPAEQEADAVADDVTAQLHGSDPENNRETSQKIRRKPRGIHAKHSGVSRKVQRKTFNEDLFIAGGHHGPQFVGIDEQGKDVKADEAGFAETMLKESAYCTTADLPTIYDRMQKNLVPDLSDFDRVEKARAHEKRLCENYGDEEKATLADELTPPATKAGWLRDAAWCDDYIATLRKDKSLEQEKFGSYNAWTGFANGFHASQLHMETQAQMLGVDTNQPEHMVRALLAELKDAKEVVGDYKTAQKQLDPTAQADLPTIATDETLASTASDACKEFKTLDVAYLRYLSRAAKQEKKDINAEGDEARTRLQQINDTKDFIKTSTGLVTDTMTKLAGAPGMIAGLSEKMAQTQASYNASANVAKNVKGKKSTSNPTYMTTDKDGNIIVKNMQTNTQTDVEGKKTEGKEKDESTLGDFGQGALGGLPSPVDIGGYIADFYYKGEVNQLNGVLKEIETRCGASDVASEFTEELAATKEFQLALESFTKTCVKLQDRMLKRRDEYELFGAALDRFAKQSKKDQDKGLAPGQGQERFATTMTLVSSIREMLSLAGSATSSFDQPKEIKHWAGSIAEHRRAKPPREFIRQFNVPAGETEALQDLHQNVDAFHSWTDLAKETYAPVEAAAASLVGASSPGGGLTAY